MIVVKGYTLAYVIEKQKIFALTLVTGFINGLFVSLFFLLKFREARAAAGAAQGRSRAPACCRSRRSSPS